MEETQSEVKQTSNGKMNMAIPIVVIALIAIVGGGIYFSNSKKDDDTMGGDTKPTAAVTQDASVSPTPESKMMMKGSDHMDMMQAYKNGTYKAVGDYTSPGGEEHVGVTVTLENNVVKDVAFEPMATRPNSVRFQGQFASGYKELVLGKKIDEVNLTKVSGSSLTPKGFNDAIDKIKAEAKS